VVARLLRSIPTTSGGHVIARAATPEFKIYQLSPRRNENREFRDPPATAADVPIILELIRALATYERAPNDVTATEDV